MYEDKSLGFWVDETVSVTDEMLVGKAFLVAQRKVNGDKFHDNVQKAYDNNIPCGMYYLANPELLFESGYSNAEWDDAINTDLNNILDAIGSRAVHFAVIGCKIKDSKDQLIEANWVAGYTQRLLDRVKEIKGIPTFHTMDPGVPDNYSGNEKEIINQFIIRNKTISTLSIATVSNGYPADGSKIQLAYDDSSLVPWAFWRFVYFAGRYDVLYNGDDAALYSVLNYIVPGNSGSTGENGGSNESTGDIDPTNIAAAINALTAAFIDFHNWLKGKFGE